MSLSIAEEDQNAAAPPHVKEGDEAEDSIEHHEVIIVGAGISALSTAKALANLGIEDVVLLEARDRLGGRIHTEERTGWDLGASWLYTPSTHALWLAVPEEAKSGLCQMADPTDTLNCTALNTKIAIYDYDGQRLEAEQVAPAEEAFNLAIQNVADKAEEENDGGVGKDIQSILETHEKKVMGKSGSLANRLFQWNIKRLEGWIGDSMRFVGCREADRFYGHEEGHDQRDFLPIGGYGPLINHFAKGLDIRYGHVVGTVHTTSPNREGAEERKEHQSPPISTTIIDAVSSTTASSSASTTPRLPPLVPPPPSSVASSVASSREEEKGRKEEKANTKSYASFLASSSKEEKKRKEEKVNTKKEEEEDDGFEVVGRRNGKKKDNNNKRSTKEATAPRVEIGIQVLHPASKEERDDPSKEKLLKKEKRMSARCLVLTIPVPLYLLQDQGEGKEQEGEGRDSPSSSCSSLVFSPPLPTRKLEAIRRINMGIFNKVFLQFPDFFWSADTDVLGFLPPPSTTTSATGSSSSPPSVPHPALFLCLHRLSSSPPHVLVAFYAGQDARDLEKLSDEEILGITMAPLKQAYAPPLGSKAVPAPFHYSVTRWASDPYAGGTYTYLSPSGTDQDRVAYSHPVDGVLFFAGEGTNVDHPACVDGACESGNRVASEIYMELAGIPCR